MPGQFAGLVAPSHPSVAQLGVRNRGEMQWQHRSSSFGQTCLKPALAQPAAPAPAGCLQPELCCVPLGAYQLPPHSVPGRWPLLMPGVLAQPSPLLQATAFGQQPAEPGAGVASLKMVCMSLGQAVTFFTPPWSWGTMGRFSSVWGFITWLDLCL